MKKKILLVDDTQDIVTVMKFLLEKNGFEVITAYDGLEGLQKTKEQKPDVVILDVKMPKMSGEEMACELAQNQETAHIPVIYLSNISSIALHSLEDKRKELEQSKRKEAFLTKSCSEQELVSTIQKVLA